MKTKKAKELTELDALCKDLNKLDTGKQKMIVNLLRHYVFDIETPVNSILWKVLWRAAVAFGVDRKLYM